MKPGLLLMLAGAALTACDRTVGPTDPATLAPRGASLTQAGTTRTNDRMPIITTAPNSCNGDVLTLTGYVHIVRTDDADGSARLHINYSSLSGIGLPSGSEYQVAAVGNAKLIVVGAGSEEDDIINEELIGKGTTPNLSIHLTVAYKFDGTTTTVETKRMSVECH